MPATSSPIRSRISFRDTDFGPASAPASRRTVSLALLGALALFGGCQTADVAARATYDVNAAPPADEEFSRSAKILFKRCVSAFGDDDWEQMRTDAKRLESLAERWRERPSKSAKHATAKREWTTKLAAASKRLGEAAGKKDSALASSVLGEASTAVARLREIEPPPATKGEE